ncbi:hypothetical protein [Caulobacter sp. RL271]|uniref:Uncharacterized protein n=1 Tax=Caulobacter segnis TaxID=88688 RepID=A0ABY4ZXK7_9CAUL|nr:hypothetical protein [Caulobacter segnis]USQ97286.1 hypothetical protein MZV50_07005 [Caulobacter segnis]
MSGGVPIPGVEGYVTPRLSWPREATPTTLEPRWAGEFVSFDDWVNFATNRLAGTVDPLMGGQVGSVCVDAFGRRCTMGGHFQRARDEGAFPVRYFFDCAPAPPREHKPSSDVTIGLIMAATIVMQGHGEDTIASEILTAAGITSTSAAIMAGADPYDLEALKSVFAELERKEALEAATAVRATAP